MHSLDGLETNASPLGKAEYRERATRLRQELLSAQTDLRKAGTNALLVVSGVDAGGKGDTVQLFNEWMDPRWIRTHAFDDPTSEETERPAFWRYWRRLPPRGEIALFLSAWYSNVLHAPSKAMSGAALETQLDRIRNFEQMLANDGMLIFKLWLHLDKDAQEARLRALEADPLQSWRVTRRDWESWERHAELAAAAAQVIDATHTKQCRWHVIEASDERRRAVEAGETLKSALRSHTAKRGGKVRDVKVAKADSYEPATSSRDGSEDALGKKRYREELARLQARLNELHRRARAADVPLVGVFEGRDAAGKGGAIRRLVAALDPRCVDVARIGPPSDEERRHHYLWRFWRRIPRASHVALFDRSWYGRVLVERVEEIAAEEDWQRAYAEINDFEEQLVEGGTVLAKFWLEIDRDEQKRRFKDRSRTPHKMWKLTEDDRRNRRLWKPYNEAIDEMLERTSTKVAPWTIIEANDKRQARLDILECVANALDEHLAALPRKRGRRARAS